jgi:5-methylcytosine-specific restriction endonuclease McrA
MLYGSEVWERVDERIRIIEGGKGADRLKCLTCGIEFKVNPKAKGRQKYCSARCCHVAYERRKGHIKVFNRDGWYCQICGKHTPKKNRGKRYSNSPELDHRIPMSRGGGHLYSNAQCACRACNISKSNNDCRGQLPLFEIKTKAYPIQPYLR